MNTSLDSATQELYKQELHYIEVEYMYRPRYKADDLRPRCKQSGSKQSHKHKRS